LPTSLPPPKTHTHRPRQPFRCTARYALLPYLYTQFLAANASGAPVMRPLFYEFPEEPDFFAEQHNFMLGGWVGGQGQGSSLGGAHKAGVGLQWDWAGCVVSQTAG
jgi:hypothetical protein